MVKIYQGVRKYNQIFPKRLKRGVTFYNLSKSRDHFVFKGKVPAEGSTSITLQLVGSDREETFSLLGDHSWEANLSESVGANYKAAIVILDTE